MTQIKSRPIPRRKFEDRFFINLEGKLDNNKVKYAIDDIKEYTKNIKILRTY